MFKVFLVMFFNGMSNMIIIINGCGFSNDLCYNKVKFGFYVCDVILFSEIEIICKLNIVSFFVVGVLFDVFVRVLNCGYVFVWVDVGEVIYFVLKLIVMVFLLKIGF